MAITATIPTMIFPKREDYLDPDEWVTQAETAYDVLSGSFTTNANLFATQANDLETNVNDKELSATAASTNASNSATSASNSATTATTKSSEASISASQAETFASEASTSASQSETFAQQAQASAASVDASNIVHKTGNETIDGVKTFSSSPIVPTPTDDTQATNKAYIDTQMNGLGTAATRDVGTAVGNVMEVGAGGLLSMAINIATSDVHIVRPTGWYMGPSMQNAPDTGWWYFNYIKHDDKFCTVIAYSLITSTPRKLIKICIQNTWYNWVEEHHTGNILQTTGTSTEFPMSQKAVTDAIITEKVYNLTGTEINPANGTIQYKTVSANTTFTETLTAGLSVILRLISANSYTITFPTITWVGVTAPILTANCEIVLWKEQSTLYGAYVGSLV